MEKPATVDGDTPEPAPAAETQVIPSQKEEETVAAVTESNFQASQAWVCIEGAQLRVVSQV